MTIILPQILDNSLVLTANCRADLGRQLAGTRSSWWPCKGVDTKPVNGFWHGHCQPVDRTCTRVGGTLSPISCAKYPKQVASFLTSSSISSLSSPLSQEQARSRWLVNDLDGVLGWLLQPDQPQQLQLLKEIASEGKIPLSLQLYFFKMNTFSEKKKL